MHSGYVMASYVTAIGVHRDQASSDHLGTLLVADSPQDHNSTDSLNNSNLELSQDTQINSFASDEKNTPRDLIPTVIR